MAARIGPGSRTIWNDERCARLRKLWGTMPLGAIAERFGCSKSAIDAQRRKLNLPKLDPLTMRLLANGV